MNNEIKLKYDPVVTIADTARNRAGQKAEGDIDIIHFTA